MQTPQLSTFRPTPRLRLGLFAGRAMGALSRRTGRGSGVVLGGRTTLAIAPDALAQLAYGRRSVIVTGTNGKSTTTRLVGATLGGQVASNLTGANMAPGVVTALAQSDQPLAVLEVDELHVPSVMRSVHPDVVVVLNVTRDQLDRTHEVSKTAQVWARVFDEQPRVHVVANAADPHVVDAAEHGQPVWVDPAGPRWTEDASVCPRCGQVLQWDADGRWSSTCGFVMPDAAYVLTDAGVRLPDGQVVPFELQLPGDINRGNAAFAIAAAVTMGIDPRDAAARMGAVHAVDGRYADIRLSGRSGPLLLAKNPAGWVAALTMIPDDAVVIVGINARTADGADTSWLWDVPFEQLAGRTVGVTGDRRADLAVRLHYAGTTPVVAADPQELARILPEGPLAVAANYTAFRELQRFIVDEPVTHSFVGGAA